MSKTVRALAITCTALAAAALTTGTAAAAATIPLNPEQETTVVESDGSGFFSYTTTADQLCYTLEVRRLTGAPVAAHIHVGARNVPGPVVVGLATPPAATSTVSECITAAENTNMTPAELAAITANPRAYYVNVHTQRFPGGEVRGQLK